MRRSTMSTKENDAAGVSARRELRALRADRES